MKTPREILSEEQRKYLAEWMESEKKVTPKNAIKCTCWDDAIDHLIKKLNSN